MTLHYSCYDVLYPLCLLAEKSFGNSYYNYLTHGKLEYPFSFHLRGESIGDFHRLFEEYRVLHGKAL